MSCIAYCKMPEWVKLTCLSWGGLSLRCCRFLPAGRVLVHCARGISRSAALVLAFLMIKERLTLVEAAEVVHKHRNILPNVGFLNQLRHLDSTLALQRRTTWHQWILESRAMGATFVQCEYLNVNAPHCIFFPNIFKPSQKTHYVRCFLTTAAHLTSKPQMKISAVHDGTYRMVSYHWLHTAFQDALWVTMSSLHSDRTTNSIEVHVVNSQ